MSVRQCFCKCFDELKTGKFWASLFAEALGTMMLVVAACGSALVTSQGNTGATTVQISLGFGFSVATMVSRLYQFKKNLPP